MTYNYLTRQGYAEKLYNIQVQNSQLSNWKITYKNGKIVKGSKICWSTPFPYIP